MPFSRGISSPACNPQPHPPHCLHNQHVFCKTSQPTSERPRPPPQSGGGGLKHPTCPKKTHTQSRSAWTRKKKKLRHVSAHQNRKMLSHPKRYTRTNKLGVTRPRHSSLPPNRTETDETMNNNNNNNPHLPHPFVAFPTRLPSIVAQYSVYRRWTRDCFHILHLVLVMEYRGTTNNVTRRIA